MPPKPKTKAAKKVPGGPAVTTKPVPGLGAAAKTPDVQDTAAARRNVVTIPPRDTYQNFRLAAPGKELYRLITTEDVNFTLTAALYYHVASVLPKQRYVADFQLAVRDLLMATLMALVDKRYLPRPPILRHLLTALVFYAPKDVVPLVMAAQIVAQEAIYTKLSMQVGEEISMRTISYALGQVAPSLQIAGSGKENPFYTHSGEHLEGVLRGFNEGLKDATMYVASDSLDHVIANSMKMGQGIREGYEELGQEFKKLGWARRIDRFLGIFRGRR